MRCRQQLLSPRLIATGVRPVRDARPKRGRSSRSSTPREARGGPDSTARSGRRGQRPQGVHVLGVSGTRIPAAAGVPAVVVGAMAAVTGSWRSDADLRSGVIPWAFGALLIGVALILSGSCHAGIG